MTDKLSLSTIVPVLNEAEAIRTAIEKIHEFVEPNFDDFEIIIVESGSTDGSYELCDQLAAEMPAVEVIHEGAANGFGSALKLGFGRAAKDLVWVVSADLPFALEKMLEALPHFADHDCVLSYRVEDDRGVFRRFQSVIYNNLAKSLLDLTVTHVNSTFKVYKRGVIQQMPIEARGWMADAEIVYQLEHGGATFTEIPVPLIDRVAGSSTITPLTPIKMFRDLVKLAIRLRRTR